ncbi:MAG: glycosyltransferase [Cyanobacteria bacterium J06581_3]
MKILHVIPSLSPNLGGPAQVALNLVNALNQLGVDAAIATTNHGMPSSLSAHTHRQIDYTYDTENNLSAPVHFLSYTHPPLKEFIFSKALTHWLWNNLSAYDLVDNHYLFSYPPTCAAAVARRKGIPYTVRTMGQLTHWALAQSATKKKIFSLLFEQRNLKKAAAIHCTSSEEAKNVRDFGILTPTVTLPLGVTPPQLTPNAKEKLHTTYQLPQDVPVLLFLSRLHHKKQPELLLKAAKQIIKKRPCHIILAGTGEPQYCQQLELLTRELGISASVTFAGFVTGYDKNLLLQGSDAFVLPSHSENFGIAVAEALISGLPAIITPGIQISAEIKAAEAGIVTEATVDGLVSSIETVLTNDVLREQLKENGLNLAKTHYSWQAIAKDLAVVYEGIIAQQGAKIFSHSTAR